MVSLSCTAPKNEGQRLNVTFGVRAASAFGVISQALEACLLPFNALLGVIVQLSIFGADAHLHGIASSSSESSSSRSTWMNVFLILRLPRLEQGWLTSKPSKSKLLQEIKEKLLR